VAKLTGLGAEFPRVCLCQSGETMQYSAKRGLAIACRLSVRL